MKVFVYVYKDGFFQRQKKKKKQYVMESTCNGTKNIWTITVGLPQIYCVCLDKSFSSSEFYLKSEDNMYF